MEPIILWFVSYEKIHILQHRLGYRMGLLALHEGLNLDLGVY